MKNNDLNNHYASIAFSEKSCVILTFIKTEKGWKFENMTLIGIKSLTSEQIRQIEAFKFEESIKIGCDL